MSQSDWVQKVTEFNVANGYAPPPRPTLPLPPEKAALRLHLMMEELGDVSRALNENDIIKLADGICDLLYVVIGTAVETGLGPSLSELFDEVHRSNMTKDLGPRHAGHRGAVKGARFEPPNLARIIADAKLTVNTELPCCPGYAEDPNRHSPYCPKFQ